MTQIRISDETKAELDLQGFKGESYDTIIKRNINFVKKFSNEAQFRAWFEKNYKMFGFTKILEKSNTSYPDFILMKDGAKVRVELETLASHFILHRHDPSKADLVICLYKDKELPIQTIEIEPFEYIPPQTGTVRLDLNSYNILVEVRDHLNAEKKKKGRAENAAFQDAVRFMRSYVPAAVFKKEKAQAQEEI